MVLLGPVGVAQVEAPALGVGGGDVLDDGVGGVDEPVPRRGDLEAEVGLLPDAGSAVPVADPADALQGRPAERHVGPEQVIDRDGAARVGGEMTGQGAVRPKLADGVDTLPELPGLVPDLATAHPADRRILEEGQQALEPVRLGDRRRRR